MELRDKVVPTNEDNEDGLVSVSVGPCLFSSIKLVYDEYNREFQFGDEEDPEDGMAEGGAAALDVISRGYSRGEQILSHRIKAYWFTFAREDYAEVKALFQTAGHDSPELWVKAGFATVSLCLPTAVTTFRLLTAL